jgi:hypothetical protein
MELQAARMRPKNCGCKWKVYVLESGLQFFRHTCHPYGMATKSKKNPAAVALGRLGGLKGGPALAAKMTPAQRKAAGRKAALARWSKKSKKP